MMETVFMEEMTWRAIRQAMENGADSVLIPLGAIEQHGPHLPIFTDAWLGHVLCGSIAGKVGNMLVAPPVYPGRSDHHMHFPGTITLSDKTFKAVVKDYCRSLADHGFGKLALVATHGGNHKAVCEVLPEIQAELAGVKVISVGSKDSAEISRSVNEELGLDLHKCGQHAGLTETSMLLATCPELVHMEWAEEGWMGPVGQEFGEKLMHEGIQAFSEFGILGDPREATGALGDAIIERRAAGYAQKIREQLAQPGGPLAGVGTSIERHGSGQLLLEQMTWREIREAMKAGWDTVLVVPASVEQHGPHLPIGTDAMLGYQRGPRLARELGKALVAPVVRPGLSEHHMTFPGTISLRRDTFAALVFEFCVSVAQHGFAKMVLMPTHGGNYAAMAELLPKIQAALPDVKVVLLGREESRAAHSQIQSKLGLDRQRAGAHAGLMETSLMLAHRPDLIHMEDAQEGWIGDFDDRAMGLLLHQGTHALSQIGVLGDPRGASVELGNSYLDDWTAIYAKVVRERFREYD